MGVHRNIQKQKMSLDLYTRDLPLTQKARFWSNYVSSLKGSQDLCAPEEKTVSSSQGFQYSNVSESLKYSPYLPVHTEIYGTYRARSALTQTARRVKSTYET